MKLAVKIPALFIFFAIAFSGFTACNRGSDNGGGGSTNVSEAAKKKSDYPAVPAAVMQAEYKGLDGGKFKLEDYKGKVVLVNFWATWCGPCRNEMPHLVEMQNTYRDKGFEILGLDVDEESPEMINDFAGKMKLNYTLGWIENKDYEEYLKISKFQGIPQTFLISREGQLLGVFTGGSPTTIAKLKDIVGKTVNE
ncbi:MAG: TlpA family protein disulfide reductase [Acidobacteriota bacterium]|nr:TlpA family protein disulfide reductase [Acidobacteriota bacterium]